jgi:hypothetical protein
MQAGRKAVRSSSETRLRVVLPGATRTTICWCANVLRVESASSLVFLGSLYKPVGHLASHSTPACLQKIALDRIPKLGLASPVTWYQLTQNTSFLMWRRHCVSQTFAPESERTCRIILCLIRPILPTTPTPALAELISAPGHSIPRTKNRLDNDECLKQCGRGPPPKRYI